MVHVLIVGVSTRAAAESAARAGYDVTALDAYADVDQHASVRALSLPRDFGEPFSPQGIVAAARDLPGDAVVYLSSFENHPAEVDALAAGRALWGNASGVLRQVRDPKMLADAFAQHGIRAPRVCSAQEERTERTAGVDRWVSKPRVSGGGHGVRLWRAGEPPPRGHYLQEMVEGIPGSVVFVAAGGRGVALATSRQLVGESAFGASGFRYCGSILSPAGSADVAGSAIALVDAVTAVFPLVGVGAIDFVATDDGLRPVELNPRWSASMELVEHARGVSMFGVHADACAKCVLPKFDLRDRVATGTYGKAVLFARRDVVVGDIRKSVGEQNVRDVPRQGEHIAEGQPICTVLAASSDDAGCYAMLVERAERIYGELGRQVTG
jgi:predicted ATP-grasp superfamily ATP-dependent carboligase